MKYSKVKQFAPHYKLIIDKYQINLRVNAMSDGKKRSSETQLVALNVEI
jgi:hypothetical protein